MKENRFFELVKMFIEKFEFRKALKISERVKQKQPNFKWLVDYVVLFRQRYLSEVGLEKEHDDVFKNQSTKKTMEEIDEIITSLASWLKIKLTN